MKLNQISPTRTARARTARASGAASARARARPAAAASRARSAQRRSIKGFEGGQMPLYRRLPKRGFNNIFAVRKNEVNLGRIQTAIDKGDLKADQPITVESLIKAGVIRRAHGGVRLLGKGEIKAKLAFEVEGASKSAVSAVEKLGGTVKVLRKEKTGSEKQAPAKGEKKSGKEAGGEASA
jgi:large subunit ribosomal protein L15